MRNYLILLVIVFFSSTAVLAQPGGPGGPPVTTEPCECCEEMEPDSPEYYECANACMANEKPCTPIDSSILILVLLGASLGIYKVYKNKKRQIVN